MSVATASPFQRGAKRTFEEECAAGLVEAERQAAHAKRLRVQRSPPAGRCGLHTPDFPGYAIPPATLTALCNLFPEMDEKTVSDVLAECGSNIDAAIKRLTDLRLGSEEAAVAAAAAAAATPPGPGTSEVDVPGSSGRQTQAPAPAGPQTGDQWIDYLVSEMAAARDMGDARARASAVLKNFEAFLKTQHKGEGGGSTEAAELARQNAVLKRAVQIQAQRLQDKSEAEGELSRLRHMLAQYQEQVRALELSNYSLTVHLQKATASSAAMPHPRNPDIF